MMGAAHLALTATLLTAALGLSLPSTPASSPAYRAVHDLLAERGKLPLAVLGAHLQREGIALDAPLSQFVLEHDSTLRVSGRPSHRLVELRAQGKDAALVRHVVAALSEHDRPLSTAELRLRLRERRTYVPGLCKLLAAHNETFATSAGGVALRGDAAAADGDGAATAAAAASLVRLRSLGLEEATLAPFDGGAVGSAVLIDLDNAAAALEDAVARAAADETALVLAFCSPSHNPRVAAAAADQMRALRDAGRLRLLVPEAAAKNAADFVMAFWAGRLHAALPHGAAIELVSSDGPLATTVGDTLRADGRRDGRRDGGAPRAARAASPRMQLSSGFTFDDGEQVLISAQRPLGLTLEEGDAGGCAVAELADDGSAARAGARVGDLLLAVNNQDTSGATIEQVMERIANAPRVVNLRFQRPRR